MLWKYIGYKMKMEELRKVFFIIWLCTFSDLACPNTGVDEPSSTLPSISIKTDPPLATISPPQKNLTKPEEPLPQEQPRTQLPILFMAPSPGTVDFGLESAARMAIDRINSDDTILKDFELVPTYEQTLVNTYVAYGGLILANHVQEGRIPLLSVLADPSNAVELEAEVGKVVHIPQITSQNLDHVLLDEKEYPLLVAGRPSVLNILNAKRDFFRRFGWSRIGVVYDYTNQRNLFNTVTQLKSHFPSAQLFIHGMDPTVVKSMWDALQELKKSDVRVIMAEIEADTDALAKFFFCQVYKSGMYGEKYVWLMARKINQGFERASWFTYVNETENCPDEHIAEAADRHLFFSNVFLRTDNVTSISGLKADEYMTKLRNKTPTALEQTSFAFDAVYSAAMALEKTSNFYKNEDWIEMFMNENTRETVAKEMNQLWRGVTFEGVSGRWVYNERNDRGGDTDMFLVFSNGSTTLIGTHYYPDRIDLREGAERLMFQGKPPPLDRMEKITKLSRVSQEATTTALVLAIGGICLALVFLMFNVVYRNDKVVKMSSPKINSFITLGAIFCFSSVVVDSLDTRYVSRSILGKLCTVWAFLISLGFTLLFGSLFAKTWRIYRLFNAARSMTKLGIKDIHLYILIALLSLVDICLLLAWTQIYPLDIRDKEIDRMMDTTADQLHLTITHECHCEHQQELVITVSIYKGIILIYGLFLAWQTRGVEILALNDSKYIGFSVYLVSIASAIAVITVPSLRAADMQEEAFIVLTICVWTCTTVTLCIIFVPKINMLFLHPEEKERAMGRLANQYAGSNANSQPQSIDEAHGVKIDQWNNKLDDIHPTEPKRRRTGSIARVEPIG